MIPALNPTRIIASVAAACELLRPKIKSLCVVEYLNVFCVAYAASHLPKRATTVSVTATIRVLGPLNTIERSTSIPTEIRNIGINNAFPKNSIRFIKADE